ncbi:uncharacterized protein LOC131242151 isoform X2 [Magnolia sinica]|uniref:uncharacterized protein LOC131242151 isoform X2 n=1 Tax=Magnolia sinica TaxID=86752 RepID=UPI0026599D53|nr:uncharacterized protein LOC131242151 isoform X2 [Magnolia sinica]
MAESGDRTSEVLDSPMERMDGGDLIINLQSQLKSLRYRVEELELENARLSSLMADCRCQKIEDETEQPVDGFTSDFSAVCVDGSLDSSRGLTASQDMCTLDIVQESSEDGRDKDTSQKDACGHLNGLCNERPIKCTRKKSRERLRGCDLRTMPHNVKRFVALKIMYFGQRFYGFASEAHMDPTVESEIFKALEKTRLLGGDKKDIQYSRCGRTDKGVSATGQVIALFLRSNLKDTGGLENYEEITPKQLCEEIDYVRVLNRVLPKDIRVVGWCPAPTNLHARFSCISRQYKYLFWKENLDISAMEIASKKLIGEHDFRNFCKMDAVNVHNYRRRITSFEISSCNERSDGNGVWAMTIKGSAFLWHQVRCMVAVLFMIGQGLESPRVIDVLLDTNRTPRKPQFVMASELPLVLQSCEFKGLDFICSSGARRTLHEHLKSEFQTCMLQATIFDEALSSLPPPGGSPLELGEKKRAHVPLLSRPTEPSYEERRAKSSASFSTSHELMNEVI